PRHARPHFPYTSLFRSRARGPTLERPTDGPAGRGGARPPARPTVHGPGAGAPRGPLAVSRPVAGRKRPGDAADAAHAARERAARSEEHTPELHSPTNLL